MRYIFDHPGDILVLYHGHPISTVSSVVKRCEEWGETTIKMHKFNKKCFLILSEYIENRERLAFTLHELPEIIDICSYLCISENIVQHLIPSYLDESAPQKCLPSLYKLLQGHYLHLVKNLCRQFSLPEHVILRLRNLPYRQFKQKFRNVRRSHEKYCKKHIPTCVCEACGQFRHNRLLQLEGGNFGYPNPHFGKFTRPWYQSSEKLECFVLS